MVVPVALSNTLEVITFVWSQRSFYITILFFPANILRRCVVVVRRTISKRQ